MPLVAVPLNVVYDHASAADPQVSESIAAPPDRVVDAGNFDIAGSPPSLMVIEAVFWVPACSRSGPAPGWSVTLSGASPTASQRG
jgi:hypothetical protein